MAPFRSLLAPFGRILVTFVEGLGDFLEAFPRQMEICTYVLEFFLSLFPFSALPVPLLRQVDTACIANPSFSPKIRILT